MSEASLLTASSSFRNHVSDFICPGPLLQPPTRVGLLDSPGGYPSPRFLVDHEAAIPRMHMGNI
jgi:hypothetical protein